MMDVHRDVDVMMLVKTITTVMTGNITKKGNNSV
jgi:hypothetical protein